MSGLFHSREEILEPGSLIYPGRWGQRVLMQGAQHQFYRREVMMENWRAQRTNIKVSRLNCAFTFDSYEDSVKMSDESSYIYSVKPIDPNAGTSRFDMLWLTWMSEKNATEDNIWFWISSYWQGKSTRELKTEANPSWEILWGCPLIVLKLVRG